MRISTVCATTRIRSPVYVPQSFERSTPFKCVLVIFIVRCLGADLRPFFLVVGPLGTTDSAAVACRPSCSSVLRRSASFGTFKECHRSRNSMKSSWAKRIRIEIGYHRPFSTSMPPLSSLAFISFQNTILNWPSFAVLVTNTSPSFSSSSMAWGASFHDSFKARTGMPPPFRVCFWISTSKAALLRKLKSCYRSIMSTLKWGELGWDEGILCTNRGLSWGPSKSDHGFETSPVEPYQRLEGY